MVLSASVPAILRGGSRHLPNGVPPALLCRPTSLSFAQTQIALPFLRHFSDTQPEYAPPPKKFSDSEFRHMASAGDLAGLKRLLEMGIQKDVNAPNYDRRTPLHLAAAEGQLEVVQYLVSKGADVNAVDRFGNTPINDAVRQGREEVQRFLIQSGAMQDSIESGFYDNLRPAIRVLGTFGSWDYAEAFVPSHDQSHLHFAQITFTDSGKSEVADFRCTSEETKYARGEGVPGQVWEKNKPQFVAKCDQKSAFASSLSIPLSRANNVLAVLTFYSVEPKVMSEQAIKEFTTYAHSLLMAESVQASVMKSLTVAQQDHVKLEILSKGVFSNSIIFEETDWFFNHLRPTPFYFERFSPKAITQHVHTFIAAKKMAQASGHEEDINVAIEEPNGSGFYLCPATHPKLIATEHKIEERIHQKHGNEGVSVSHFISQGSSSRNADNKLGFYILDRQKFVNPDAGPNCHDLNQVASHQFLETRSQLVQDRYSMILSEAVSRMSPVVKVFPDYRDGTIPVMIGFRSSFSSRSVLSDLSDLLETCQLSCERKFLETFSNNIAVLSLYLHEVPAEKVESFTQQLLLLFLVPRTRLTPLYLDGVFNAKEYAYVSCVSRFLYYFLNQESDDYNELANALSHDPVNASRLLSLSNRLRRDAVSLTSIIECLSQHPQIISKLFRDFERIHASPEVKPFWNKDIHSQIKKATTRELDSQILTAFLVFNQHCLKTNFNKYPKSTLSFRLDPGFLDGQNGLQRTPYGIFFVLSRDFQGFHVRFEDVARGGIRMIKSNNAGAFQKNTESLFMENYNLALTQNKKNKDIPEFGSKGTVLMFPGYEGSEGETFRKYVAGLLDLLLPHPQITDHYGKPEILFLGPDEGTADLMQWAAEYAKRRGYDYWKAFTTGKPPKLGGIPHDTYGMTTRSVHRYVLEILKKRGLEESEVTKLQTGGPDGDLGSNEILISKDKTTSIVDGSGVVHDPAGLNRTELERLAHARLTINHFDKSKLGPDGFLVLVEDRDVQLPNGEAVDSGLDFRNSFHLNPLSSADLFVPCGGRPESVSRTNVQQMFDDNGNPRFKFVVEGANLFLTEDARAVLEKAGVILYKDASANKGGVTSSSLEVLAALCMTDSEFAEHMCVTENHVPEFYKHYVEDVQRIIDQNALLEFQSIWAEHETSGVPHHVLTDTLSDKINSLNNAIASSSLMDNKELERKVLGAAIPAQLSKLLGLDTVIERLPHNYKKAIFSAYLASRYVYSTGLHGDEFSFYNYMKKLE